MEVIFLSEIGSYNFFENRSISLEQEIKAGVKKDICPLQLPLETLKSKKKNYFLIILSKAITKN
jgi:hypothetical protein